MLTLWAPIAVPLLVTAAWLWLPGLPLALALRARSATAAAVSPLLSIAIICVAAIGAPAAGLAWGPLPVIMLTLPLWGLAWLIRWATARRHRPSRAPRTTAARHRAFRAAGSHAAAPLRSTGLLRRAAGSIEIQTFAAIGLAAALMARHVRNVIDRPDALSQTFDNIFHQNAVRWILDHGDASSLHLLRITAFPGDPTFYPAAWHDLVSLTLLSTGSTDIPLATNALALATCALIWTSGMVLLIRATLPSSLVRVGLLPGAVLAASFPGFPILFLEFGVLYSNLLGLSLLPVMIVLGLRLVGLARPLRLSIGAALAIALVGSVSISLAHPNASMVLIAVSIPIALAAAVRAAGRAASSRSRSGWATPAVLVALAAAVLALASWIWPIIRPPEEALTWPPVKTQAEALGEALMMNPMGGWQAWPLTAVFAIGLYAAVRRREFALPAAWAVVVHLWIAVAAWPDGEHRTALVGVWYNDPFRIAAVLAIPSIPIAALGAAHALRWAADRLPRAPRIPMLPITGLIGSLVLIALTQASPWMNFAVERASEEYQLTPESELLTADELALIERIPTRIPADSVVITDPWNGSSLLYAYTGIRTTTVHTLEYHPPQLKTIEDHLSEASSDPRVCEAIAEENATYVLDFGLQQINDGTWPRPGFADLATAPGFELVDAEGSARLYRIDACGG